MKIIDGVMIVPQRNMGVRDDGDLTVHVIHADKEDMDHILNCGAIGIAIYEQSYLDDLFGEGCYLNQVVDRDPFGKGRMRTCFEFCLEDGTPRHLKFVTHTLGQEISVMEPIQATGGAYTRYESDSMKLVDMFGAEYLDKIVSLGTNPIESKHAPLWTSRVTLRIDEYKTAFIDGTWVQIITEHPFTTARVCYTHDTCPECFGVVCPHYRERGAERD